MDPTKKQPHAGWIPGQFLGINRQAGDAMTYFIETENGKGRNVVLMRSTIRSKVNCIETSGIDHHLQESTDDDISFHSLPSGENIINNNNKTINDDDVSQNEGEELHDNENNTETEIEITFHYDELEENNHQPSGMRCYDLFHRNRKRKRP